jgi:predicted dehydrogenase
MRRRDFLTASLTASAFAFTARSYAQIAGANNRARLALIGCGGRGMFVARLMREAPETQFVAACDVYDGNAGRAKEWAGADAIAYKDFRRALDRKDIDAVLVATPDHWHAIPTVLACQAGKDVYVEKPLAHNIREGRAMVDAARKHKRIVQTGTQHRSAPHYRQIQEIIARGDIGAVRFIRVWNYVNRTRGSGGVGATAGSSSSAGNPPAQPPGLDWDFYLGPAPLVPFDRTRFLGSFRNYFDYAGGYVTDWGTHRFDSVRQVMNEANPLTASASGRRYELKDGGDTPDVVQATVQFPEFTMSYEAIQINGHGAAGRTPEMKYYRMAGAEDRPHGEAFYGTKGTIISDRIGFDLYPEVVGTLRVPSASATAGSPSSALKRQSIPSRDTTDLHTANFIDCVRTRKPPAAEVEIGHLSSIVPHLINIAYRTGEKLQWDADSEAIKGAPDSSALLTRRARPPWNIVEGT